MMMLGRIVEAAKELLTRIMLHVMIVAETPVAQLAADDGGGGAHCVRLPGRAHAHDLRQQILFTPGEAEVLVRVVIQRGWEDLFAHFTKFTLYHLFLLLFKPTGNRRD